MKKLSILALLVLGYAFNLLSQDHSSFNKQLRTSFNAAYAAYPTIPQGILEAVAYTKTHLRHLTPATDPMSCLGLPTYIGIMGMTDKTTGYFKNTLLSHSKLSGISVARIKGNPAMSIMAYACSFAKVQKELNINTKDIKSNISVIKQLSELPSNSKVQNYALDAEIYSILKCLSNSALMHKMGRDTHIIEMEHIFGIENLKVLSSKHIYINGDNIKSEGNYSYKIQSCLDYPAALWVAADPSNYSSRNGTAISAVTIHTIQGSYAGCISYFQSPSANVSAHYVVRSSDGQVTQMVCEEDKGWHVGTENPYTIGIEHEGFVNDPSWYTDSMYEGSAALVKDIINSGYGINPLRAAYWPWTATTLFNQAGIPGTCSKVKGHMHFPNQTHTDPGEYWNWDLYYKLINDTISASIITDSSGTLFDTGGLSGDYTDDERTITVINPPNTERITLEFITFDIELDWDYLYIYDGTSVWDSLMGYYTGTNSPGIVTSTGNALTLEFRSDCATTGPGWEAIWSSCQNASSGFSYSNSGLTFTFMDSSLTTGITSYLWDFGNGYFSNIQNPVFNYSNGGNYTVCQTVTDSCGMDSTCQNISVVPLAINNWITEKNGFIVYPNPFKNFFYIEKTSIPTENITIRLMDINGRIAMDFSGSQSFKETRIQKQKLDAIKLKNGVYILELSTPLSISRIKLLKL